MDTAQAIEIYLGSCACDDWIRKLFPRLRFARAIQELHELEP
jgi:hypothetical protein